ncbi:MAG TPA: hypothetical protein VFX43_18235 [Chitinophagaceae bacterium]|nr:hypothetical protein [Chitinophagaceae bacterium]
MKGKETKATHISMEEYNQELQAAEAQYESGEYTTHDDFVEQLKQWQITVMRWFGQSRQKNEMLRSAYLSWTYRAGNRYSALPGRLM